MKKNWLALALAGVCSAACLTACSEGYEGEYKLYSLYYGEKTYYVGDAFEDGGFDLEKDSLVIQLTEAKNERGEGTWTLSGELSALFAYDGGLWEEEEQNVLEFSPYGSGTDILTQCDGETLTLVHDEIKIVLKK